MLDTLAQQSSGTLFLIFLPLLEGILAYSSRTLLCDAFASHSCSRLFHSCATVVALLLEDLVGQFFLSLLSTTFMNTYEHYDENSCLTPRSFQSGTDPNECFVGDFAGSRKYQTQSTEKSVVHLESPVVTVSRRPKMIEISKASVSQETLSESKVGEPPSQVFPTKHPA